MVGETSCYVERSLNVGTHRTIMCSLSEPRSTRLRNSVRVAGEYQLTGPNVFDLHLSEAFANKLLNELNVLPRVER